MLKCIQYYQDDFKIMIYVVNLLRNHIIYLIRMQKSEILEPFSSLSPLNRASLPSLNLFLKVKFKKIHTFLARQKIFVRNWKNNQFL